MKYSKWSDCGPRRCLVFARAPRFNAVKVDSLMLPNAAFIAFLTALKGLASLLFCTCSQCCVSHSRQECS